jgi:hypothetical protein
MMGLNGRVVVWMKVWVWVLLCGIEDACKGCLLLKVRVEGWVFWMEEGWFFVVYFVVVVVG